MAGAQALSISFLSPRHSSRELYQMWRWDLIRSRLIWDISTPNGNLTHCMTMTTPTLSFIVNAGIMTFHFIWIFFIYYHEYFVFHSMGYYIIFVICSQVIYIFNGFVNSFISFNLFVLKTYFIEFCMLTFLAGVSSSTFSLFDIFQIFSYYHSKIF